MDKGSMEIAVQNFANSQLPVYRIFKVFTRNVMSRGADIAFLSV